MANEKDSPKEAQAGATVLEQASNNGSSVDVLDIDARIQQMAKDAPMFWKNRNLFILYLLVRRFQLAGYQLGKMC